MSAAQSLQTALVERLNADPLVTGFAVGPFDPPPKQITPPFWLYTLLADTVWRTKTETGRRIRFAVQLVASIDDRAGALTALDSAASALDDPVQPVDWSLVHLTPIDRLRSAETARRLERHSLRFEALLLPLSD